MTNSSGPAEMNLIFRELGDGEMDRPPTQRDQFNNDDVELVDALVRESLQNSLDASTGDQVRVRFALHQPVDASREVIKEYLDQQTLTRHLDACGVKIGPEKFEAVRLLLIEDYGTSGLTGEWDRMDQKPFSDFWRRMGKSHKAGRSLGRWGLGKLVFSSSSEFKAFFGLTVSTDAPNTPLLMGQAVLTTHEIESRRYDSHGFYCRLGSTPMQLPITDAQEIARFTQACGLRRSGECGLSVVIPAPIPSITEDRIVGAVLKNYFFPILLGRLVVEVGDLKIDAASFAQLAKKYGGSRFESGELAEFIGLMRKVLLGEHQPFVLVPSWSKTSMEKALEEHIGHMREQYTAGDAICVRAPILLKNKSGEELQTYVDLFLKQARVNADTIFVRDTIVLTAETKFFKGNRVLAALLATDRPICSFLGDAENPAHTSWSATAEKVSEEWRSAPVKLREIRSSLQQLYDQIASSIDLHDPNALVDFFSLKSESGSTGSVKRGPIVRPPNPTPPPPKEKLYRLTRLSGGFAIKGASGLDEEQLPLTIRVRTAYDVLRGNPFSKHDPLDFDFTKGDLKIVREGVSVTYPSANVISIEVTNPGFSVEVTGFDVNRDLIIDPSRS